MGQGVFINKRKHYKGRFGDQPVILMPSAVGPLTVMKKITGTQFVLDISNEPRCISHPVFHSSVLIPYETGVIYHVEILRDTDEGYSSEGSDRDGSESVSRGKLSVSKVM